MRHSLRSLGTILLLAAAVGACSNAGGGSTTRGGGCGCCDKTATAAPAPMTTPVPMATSAPTATPVPTATPAPMAIPGPVAAKASNTLCPISGKPVKPSVPTSIYQGRVIGFCCSGCKAQFDADPEAYADKIR